MNLLAISHVPSREPALLAISLDLLEDICSKMIAQKYNRKLGVVIYTKTDYKKYFFQTGSVLIKRFDNLIEVDLPNNITSIGNYVFFNNLYLESIFLPNNITFLGAGVFRGCLSLSKVSLPPNLKIIENSAFWGCIKLTHIILPPTLTTLGHYVFCYCKGLKSVLLPRSFTTLGNSIFMGCDNLKSIKISKLSNIPRKKFPSFCEIIRY